MSNYTPEPWKVETPRDRDDSMSGEGDPEWDESYPRGVTVRAAWDAPRDGSLGYEICRMSGVHERTLSDARLIAAAPALYQAAKEAIRDGVIIRLREAVELAEKGEQG